MVYPPYSQYILFNYVVHDVETNKMLDLLLNFVK